MALQFVNDKTRKTYTVVSFDPETSKMVLRGEHGVEFTETFDKELFKRLGYRPVQVEA